jgi:TolA-binding protein
MPNKPNAPDEERVARLVASFVAREVRGEGRTAGHVFALRLANLHSVRRRRRWALAAGAALALVCVGLLRLRAPDKQPGAPLSYQVDHRDPPAGGYVVAANQAETVLEFSDGSSVRMAARARGRVAATTGDGARFALEEGTLSADIRPRVGAHWLFEAGPFLVRVHGTSFTVVWAPNEARFVLRLRNGAVSVVTPTSRSEIELHTGQTLAVNLRDQTTTLNMADEEQGSASRSNGTASADVSASAAPPRSEADIPPGPARWSHRRWSARLAQGEALAVVTDAERLGAADVLRDADSEDLWAVASAARYTARYALARQALMMQRTRFPASARAREAAFLLGRLHDGDAGGPDDALGWYARYLSEAPQGAFASDALGRMMTLLERSGRQTRALAVAREYSQRFPNGTYANAARALIRAETAER